MAILMKAQRSFNGEPGEGVCQADGSWFVDTACEFNCKTQHRADELERRELAFPIIPFTKADNRSYQNKMEAAPKNKAAASGPLASPGGEIGAENAPSSSDQDPPPRQRRSKKPEAGLDL